MAKRQQRRWLAVLPVAVALGACATQPHHGGYREDAAFPVDASDVASPVVFTRATADLMIYPVRAAPSADVFEIPLISNFVDLGPLNPNSVVDFSCGSRSYDFAGYNHAGIDIVATPFRDIAVDNGWGVIVAAAPGMITRRSDGFPDRNCGGLSAGPDANYVVVQQDNGLTAYYWHMASGSLTTRAVGERVETGEFLGLIGSSGLSFEPHLHFELRSDRGDVVDPFAGRCGASRSLWRHQPATIDTGITAIYAHSAVPTRDASYCVPEVPRFQSAFQPGETVIAGAYFRDLDAGQNPRLQILDPGGAVRVDQTLNANVIFLPYSDRFVSYALPADAADGQWRIRVTVPGDTRERAFYVGAAPAGETSLAAAILPASRSVQSGTNATVFATVLNRSDVSAQGCWIGLNTPFDGRFEYRETDPATNAVTGEINAVFNLGPREARTFVLSLVPEAASAADSYDMPFRYKCDNTVAASEVTGVNSLLMSFSAVPQPDPIAIAITPDNNGILALQGADGRAAFAVASANVGSAGSLTVEPYATGDARSLQLRICETNPVTGACLVAGADAVTREFSAGETASFAVFVIGTGDAVSFAPARNRIGLRSVDGDGVIRGSTTVAVRTQ